MDWLLTFMMQQIKEEYDRYVHAYEAVIIEKDNREAALKTATVEVERAKAELEIVQDEISRLNVRFECHAFLLGV